MKEQRSIAGKASAEKRRQQILENNQPNDTDFNDRSTAVQRAFNENEQKKGNDTKETKVNDTNDKSAREKNSDYVYPKSDKDEDLIQFFTNNGSTPEEASRFFNHFNSQSWLKKNGLPISVWQSVAKQWIDRSLHDPKFRAASTESDYTKYQREYGW
jgi:hypothetical protein